LEKNEYDVWSQSQLRIRKDLKKDLKKSLKKPKETQKGPPKFFFGASAEINSAAVKNRE
jgi:hypothetical protein